MIVIHRIQILLVIICVSMDVHGFTERNTVSKFCIVKQSAPLCSTSEYTDLIKVKSYYIFLWIQLECIFFQDMMTTPCKQYLYRFCRQNHKLDHNLFLSTHQLLLNTRKEMVSFLLFLFFLNDSKNDYHYWLCVFSQILIRIISLIFYQLKLVNFEH